MSYPVRGGFIELALACLLCVHNKRHRELPQGVVTIKGRPGVHRRAFRLVQLESVSRVSNLTGVTG